MAEAVSKLEKVAGSMHKLVTPLILKETQTIILPQI